MLEVLLASMRALQRGHYELWKDTMAGPVEERRTGRAKKRRPKKPPQITPPDEDIPF